ncbi:hypothetical protein CCR75_002464 [Bremia lactucae]|uniref:PDZ domain-containing protein n=1 Tax=Bremia lactucae TaxID=4779 RepID=A0A976FDZ6_BRELC|nr:hypothetical protein CCR75_002464 [Bremia lactucae]
MADAAEAVQTGADLQLDERNMYAVKWADGVAFGFTVTPVQSDRGTVLCLARRTSPGVPDVMPGDMLIAIGDVKVYHLGAQNAAKLLRSIHKPVWLTLQVSPYGPTVKELPDLAPNEYTYKWESGPLGIVLKMDAKSNLPLVKRFTGKADYLALERDVSIGDELVYVNHTPTNNYSLIDIINIIKEMPKPITLRFRKPLKEELQIELPELGEGEYDFLWEFGSLGLVVGTSAEGMPYVRSFTGKGTSKQLSQVQENDEIILVNNRAAEDYGFHEIMRYLMNVPKPAVIRFCRSRANQNHASAHAHYTSRFSLPTTSMASLSISPLAPSQNGDAPATRSMSVAGVHPPLGRRYSLPRSTSNSSDTATGLLEYRSTRSSNVFCHQHSSKHSLMQQVMQIPEATTDTNVEASSYNDSGHSSPLPPSDLVLLQVPPQLSQLTHHEGHSMPCIEEDFFEIDSNAYYQIQWTDGPFGLTVREAQSKQGPVVLITKRTGKSTCAGLRRVAVGDILVKIGDTDVRELGFERSTIHLRNVPKPILLTLQAID